MKQYILKDFYQFINASAKIKTRAKLSIPLVISLTLILFVFGPLENYIINVNSFVFGINAFLPALSFISIIGILILLSIILPFKKRVFEIIYSSIFGISICFWVQGNFLNPVLSMNGSPFIISVKRILFSGFFWVLITCVAILLCIFKNKFFKYVSLLISYALIAIHLITLLILLLTTDISKNNIAYITDKNNFNMSSEKNIIILLIDSYDGAVFNAQLENELETRKLFKDFTAFDNYVTIGSYTSITLPYILTGNIFKNDIPYSEYVEEAFKKDTVIKQIINSGYKTNVYTQGHYLPKNLKDMGEIENLVEINEDDIGVNSPFGLAWDMCKINFVKVFPQLFKFIFWFYPEFDSYLTGTDGIKLYQQANEAFLKDIQNNENISISEDNTFKFIHVRGYHTPYSEKDAYTRGLQVTNLIKHYLDLLKKNNINGCRL